MVSLASVESNQDLAIALRRLGKTWEAAGSIAQAQVSFHAAERRLAYEVVQAISDNIILSDSLGYQSLHARQAKVCSGSPQGDPRLTLWHRIPSSIGRRYSRMRRRHQRTRFTSDGRWRS